MPGLEEYQNPLSTWALTLSVEKNPDFNTVMKIIKEVFKKWAFQKEKTSLLHWQIQGSLFKERRGKECAFLLKKAGFVFHDDALSPMSKNGCKKPDVYCMKLDTRVEGPWTDKDPEPPVLTREVKLLNEVGLRPWQQSILDISKNIDNRAIDVIVDTEGDHGKSSFAEWMEYHKFAYEIPAMRLMEDIMQCAMANPNWPAYIVDLPRGMGKDKLGDFFSGIECLKNGHLYDKRYSFKKMRMERPRIFLFTNAMFNTRNLTKGRWKLWHISDEMELVAGLPSKKRDADEAELDSD